MTNDADATIRVSGYLDVPADRLDVVAATLPEHVRLTRAEPGCVEFHAEFDADTPGRIQVRERFVDRAAFEAHQGRTRASDWARVSEGIVRHLRVVENDR